MDSRSVPIGTPPRPRREANPDDETKLIDDETPAQMLANLGATRVVNTRSVASSPTPPPDHTTSEEATEIVPPGKRQDVSVLGDYRLIKKLGEGAMGAVYQAKQISIDRNVALKVLFPHIANNPKLVARLYREGMVMGQLDHPNIVQAYGMGEDQGWHFVAMELVEGVSLQKLLDRQGRFSVGDALHITLAVARALDYAHQLGVIHRDVKPDNILITRQGNIKLTDLGMVKSMDEDMSLTDTGHAVGTPWYMPMEQAKNAKDTDGRSDLYALGCMLYCLLVGHPPFTGRTLVEVIQAKEVGTFPPAHRFNSEVPERLDMIIAKMTAKLPKYRHQTAAEVVKDLSALGLANEGLEFIHGEAVRAKPTAASAGGLSIADQPTDEHPVDLSIWYVRIKNADGLGELKKMTTHHVIALLEEGRLDPGAKASHNPKDGFRAVATYKEFEGVALHLVSKRAADHQSVNYRKLIKKIEAAELTRAEPEESESTDFWWWLIYWPYPAMAAGALFVIIIFYRIIAGMSGP